MTDPQAVLDARRRSRPSRKKDEKKHDLLTPIFEPPKHKNFLVFDVESKAGDTQDPGFERPFMMSLYDGTEFLTFRDDPEVKAGKSYVDAYWLDPGGCVDKMMRHVLGLRECKDCEIGKWDYKWGSCQVCIAARKRYQGGDWYITAHNGGNFDNLFVLGWVRKHGSLFFNNEIIAVQSRMLIFTIKPAGELAEKGKREKWTFTDSVALLSMSLEDVGKSFCADLPEFQKMQFNLELHEDDPLWEEYNRQDCVVLHTGLLNFRTMIEDIGGGIGVTAASTSMQLFRRQFLEKPIQRNSHFPGCNGKCRDVRCPIYECIALPPEERECHGCLHQFIREAYFGGRTEIFRTRGRNLFYFDINSSYPTSMLGLMPVGKARIIEGASLNEMRRMSKQNIGFVECIIEIPKNCYLPPLPYRFVKKRGEMKLIFPVGRLYGTWSWTELELALRAGARIVTVGTTVWYKAAKVFDKMILKLYSYRKKKCLTCGLDQSKPKDKPEGCKCEVRTWTMGMDQLAKLIMNSGYGKLATNPIRERIDFVPYGQISENAIIPPPWMKDAPQRVQHLLKADYIVVQMAAQITADARKRFYLGAKSVLDRKGKLVYGDSLAGDRCVVVRKPDGSTTVTPISRLFAFASDVIARGDGKEVGFLEGWAALSRDKNGLSRWMPIGGIIRHRAGKRMHLVSTKEGQTEVTSDHGIMVEECGETVAIDPASFVEEQHQFIRVEPLDGSQSQCIDLYASVSGISLNSLDGRNGNTDGVMASEFVSLDENTFSISTRARGRDESSRASVIVRRRFTSKSPAMHALLRTIGAYVAEGSSSLAGTLSPSTSEREPAAVAVRYMWSLSQNDPEWLRSIQRDMGTFIEGIHFTGPFQTTGAWVLRSGTKDMSFLFAALCGDGGSSNKRLPDFCMDLCREDFLVLWSKMQEGDGHLDKQGSRSYCTKSLQLVSQLSFLMKKHGVDHSIKYRPGKKVWTLLERWRKPRAARVVKHEVRNPRPDEYVYDLNVPITNTFVDALGCVLVHNTDSIIATLPVHPMGGELGEWKEEESGFSFKSMLPKMYMIERHAKDCRDALCDGCRVLHKKKCKDPSCPGCDTQKVAMKGVPKIVQRPDVYNHFESGSGRITIDEKTKSLVRLPSEKRDGENHAVVQFNRLTKFRRMLNSKEPMLAPRMESAERSIRTEYDKRRLLPDGIDTVPLVIEDPKTLTAAREKRLLERF